MWLSKSVLTAAILLLGFVTAEGDPLPPYSVVGDLLFNFSPPPRLFPNDLGSFSLVDGRYGSVSAAGSGQPSPSLVADATIGPNSIPGIFGRGSLLLTYAFEIVGPPGSVPVLIGVAGAAAGLATSGASFAVESRWDLLDLGSSLAGDDVRSGQLTGTFSESFNRTVSLTLSANHLYSVFMLADAAAAATLEGSRATAHAFVDPVFSFAPGVDPSYSLNFSAGIGNAAPPAVPEPGTLVLLGVGLLSGRLLRRRRTAGTQPTPIRHS